MSLSVRDTVPMPTLFSTRDSVLSIPESCIEFNNDTAFVYVVKNEKPQEFERKQVKAGLSDGINIEILEGLKLNEKVRGNEIIETTKK